MIVNLLWNQVLFCHILTPSCQDISGSNRIRGSHFLLRTLSCTSCRSFLALLPPVPALQCIITVSSALKFRDESLYLFRIYCKIWVNALGWACTFGEF